MKKDPIIFDINDLHVWYGEKHILKGNKIEIEREKVTALIGPSGCGKSTFIRCLNRMNDFIPKFRHTGAVLFEKQDIYDAAIDPIEIRLRIGMVFQKPNPFPKSIYDNITYGPNLLGIRKRSELDEIVEKSLIKAALWDEVKENLNHSALALSGGQQQRLCIARALAVEPEVLLLDEPCSALDPIATAKIEGLITEIKQLYTVVIVTHNMQQAARVSDYTGFFLMGDLLEFGKTSQIFTNPKNQKTEDYITGRYG